MSTTYYHPLRVARESENLSMEELADATNLSYRTIWRAEKGFSIQPSSRRILCEYFSKVYGRQITSQELGLLKVTTSEQKSEQISSNQPESINSLMHRQLDNSLSAALESELQASELGAIMAILFDPSKRKLLQYILVAAGIVVASPQEALQELLQIDKKPLPAKPLPVNEQILSDFEQLNDVCWRLSNNSQLEIVEQLLPPYLSKVTGLANQSSKYQQQVAALATKAHVLAAEIDKSNIVAMQAYCQQALFYSEIARDPNIKVGALRQEATIALVAKQSLKALQTYQQTLPLLGSVSPLLRSRIYLGLASANARLYKRSGDMFYQRDALKYLGLAQEYFPTRPESDPNFLYTLCNESVLRLYEALTYNDLHQPNDAWKSLMRVDGLQPKIAVTESARIEFINLQAQTAAALGYMERSCFYVQASVEAANATGYSIWREEVAEVYKELAQIWPHELQVRNLGELFK